MAYNILSSEISIFPLSKPRKTNKSSRLFYEENITNLIRQVVDVDSFIIESPETFEVTLSSDLIFNLYGYYFCINQNATLLPSDQISNDDDLIIAKIKLVGDPMEIEGQDGDGTSPVYEGLLIESLKTSDLDTKTENYKYIKLFNKVAVIENGERKYVWKTVRDSFNKFNVDRLFITGIDGKR